MGLARYRDRFSPRSIFYGWYIVVAGAGASFLLLGITAFGFGVLITGFREEYGWSVGAIALGISIRSLEQGVMSPFMGYLMDRLGPRRASVIGATVVSGSLFLFSQASTLPVYYAASIVMAMGQSLGGYGAFTLAAMRWFNRKRGRATGVITIGNSLGYTMPLIIAALFSAFGLHTTLVILGLAVFVVGVPLGLVIRDRPESMGYMPDGMPLISDEAARADGQGGGRHAARVDSGGGYDVNQVLRMPAFYLLILASATVSAGHGAWSIFQVPALESAGFSLASAAGLVSLYGLIQIPLRLASGWIGDLAGRRQLCLAGILFQAVGLLTFAFVTPDRLWLLPVYYTTFGVGHASWLVGNQAIIADYFGTKRYATIRGFAQSGQLPISIMVPLFIGYMFDRFGDYQLAFICLGLLGITAAAWFGAIRRPLWADLSRDETAEAPQAVLLEPRPATREG
jgi:MFS family permease